MFVKNIKYTRKKFNNIIECKTNRKYNFMLEKDYPSVLTLHLWIHGNKVFTSDKKKTL